jgi:hypothetical protein
LFKWPCLLCLSSLSYECDVFVVSQDRGPAGDFVYGALASAPEEVKRQRYREFMEFDAKCREDGVLFIKLLFVTDRDSIARTLGKRLGSQRIGQDLKKWLDASCGHADGTIERAGLAEIEDHLDSTDFVAFNKYNNNLEKFVEFARNTDTSESSSWFNPWLVSVTLSPTAHTFILLIISVSFVRRLCAPRIDTRLKEN